MNKKELVVELYKFVDNLDVEGVGSLLSKDVRFKFSNYDELNGIDAVLDSNRNFFTGIQAMKHTIEKIWEVESDLICHGRVDYTRHDGSHYSAFFATVLKVERNKITDYLIFADVSEL